MSDKTMDIKTVHEENRRRIVVHDVEYMVDRDGEKLIDLDSAIEQYNKGNWEYIEEDMICQVKECDNVAKTDVSANVYGSKVEFAVCSDCYEKLLSYV